MRFSIGSIFTALFWSFYAAVVYTGFNPNHEYVSFLNSFETFYLFIHIPFNIAITAAALFFYILRSALIKSAASKFLESPQDKLQMEVVLLKMSNKSISIYVIINRLLSSAAALVSLIIAENYTLGITVLLGVFSSILLVSSVRNIITSAVELSNE